MNEAEHFFDMEIKRAEDCIANDWVECFNGVEVGNELAKKLNREHIVFCKNAKKFLANYEDSRKRKIAEMQSHIDCLKAELAEIQMNKQELPEEPIKVADMLIDKHIERVREFDRYFSAENAGKIVEGRPIEEFRKAQIMELKQIAEHLLVYCNHAEVE